MTWTQTAKNLKLVGEAIQPFALILSAVGAVITFAVSERDKAKDRAVELSQPFYQKQLDLYSEAARITARLAVIDKNDKSYHDTVTRFWELYWGELSLVESKTQEKDKFSDHESVESLMVLACEKYVSPEDANTCTTPANTPRQQAYALAHHEEEELKARWLSQ